MRKTDLMQILLGFFFAILIAFLAHRAHSLDRSGAVAATIVGTVIFGVGGLSWAILLLTFFITSSALSRAFKQRKAGLNEKFSKGHERDAGQVFGNGGVATLFAALHGLYPEAVWPWIGFAAALAAGRVLHAIGLIWNVIPARMFGMILTFAALLLSGGALVFHSLA